MIRNIFFDMGNTLTRRPHDTRTALFTLLDRFGYEVGWQELNSAYDLARAQWPAQPPSEEGHAPSWKGYRQTPETARLHQHRRTKATIDNLGLSPAEEITRKILGAKFNSPQLFPDAVPTLEEAKSRGYTLGVISNWDPMLVTFCRELGIEGYFDAIIASRALGYKKWWPEIFLVALAAVGGRAEESIHVGDSPGSDAWGAYGVGMHPVVVDRERRGGRLFCPVISSLEEVFDLVEGF